MQSGRSVYHLRAANQLVVVKKSSPSLLCLSVVLREVSRQSANYEYHHTNNSVLSKHIQQAGYSSAQRHQEQQFISQSNSVHHQRSFSFICTAKGWNELPVRRSHLIPPPPGSGQNCSITRICCRPRNRLLAG